MKNKLNLALVAIIAVAIFCGCEDKPKTYVGSSKTIWVDTINIHGKSHEILLRHTSTGHDAVGGMMHSPECWCKKEGGR